MSECTKTISDPKIKVLTKERFALLLLKLKTFVTHVMRTFSILEALLGIFYGGIVGALLGNAHNGWLQSSVAVLTLIYVPLLILKIRAQWTLPAHFFDDLQAVAQLNDLQKELARKSSIDLFVDNAIKALNAETCSISTGDPDHTFCSEAVKDGLQPVLMAVINRPQEVFDCNMAAFSVGARVCHRVRTVDVLPDANEPANLWIDKFLIFRDDLRIGEEIEGDPFNTSFYAPPPKGAVLAFRHAIERAVNENRMDMRQVTIGSKNVQLISSPIPLVCDEDSANGAIWVCRECVQPAPEDLENILRIFGRIVANWLYKYNTCIAESEARKTVAASSGNGLQGPATSPLEVNQDSGGAEDANGSRVAQ